MKSYLKTNKLKQITKHSVMKHRHLLKKFKYKLKLIKKKINIKFIKNR